MLASAGLDEQLMLLDRRSNSVAASVNAGLPLHAMACRDDGMTIAAGTSGETPNHFGKSHADNVNVGLPLHAGLQR